MSCAPTPKKRIQLSAQTTQLPPELAPALKAAVRAVNTDANAAQQPRWAIEEARTIFGWTVERYKLGQGPQLAVVPDPMGTVVSYELWTHSGWGDDPVDQEGLTARLLYALSDLGGENVLQRDVGVGRDMSFVRWIARPDDQTIFETLLAEIPKPSETPPALSWPRDGSRILHQLERALQQARQTPHSSANKPSATDAAAKRRRALLSPEQTLWVVSGAVDRIHTLRTMRRAPLSPLNEATAPVSSAANPWPPRLPFQVSTDAEHRVVLAEWEISQADPERMVSLLAIARVLADGPESRLGRSLWGTPASGIEMRAHHLPGGGRLSLFAVLDHTTSATVATAHVRDALEALGTGATTGIELEYARAGVWAELLSTWTTFEGRGQLVAETLWAHGSLEALERQMTLAKQLDEPTIRKAAQSLAKTRPAVVWSAPSASPPKRRLGTPG